MAITTYAELKTAVADWLDRSDLAAKTDDFIDLAEASMNRDLRIREMEASVTFSLTTGTHDYSIDTNIPGLLEIRSVSLATTPESTLSYFPPHVLKKLWEVDANGVVRGYSLSGDNFRVAPAPDASNSVNCTVEYFKEIVPLDATNTQNDMLLDHPDIYLYGALLHAAPYLLEDARVPMWQAMYDKAVASALEGDKRGQHSNPQRDRRTG